MTPTTLYLTSTQETSRLKKESLSIAADASNRFAFDLYRRIKADDDNIFLSPISIYLLLLMVLEGAGGATRKELMRVLRLKNDVPQEPPFPFSGRNPTAPIPLHVANAIWLRQGIPYEQDFRERLMRKFSATINSADFSDKQATVRAINKWVSQATRGLIPALVSSERISREMTVLLANAIYFEDQWRTPFDRKKTRTDHFFGVKGINKSVNFMNATRKFSYYEEEVLQLVTVPYRSGLSFCVLLPRERYGLPDLEAQMDQDLINTILRRASTRYDVVLSLPKFQLTSDHSLVMPLHQMGMTSAFSTEADFSGIVKEAPFKIDHITHKAFIEIDEEKTRAAAVTGFAVSLGLVPERLPPKIFKADHPFLFFIINDTTKGILFMGRVVQL